MAGYRVSWSASYRQGRVTGTQRGQGQRQVEPQDKGGEWMESTKGGQTSLTVKPDGLGSHPHSPQEEAPDSPRKHQDGAKSPALGDVEGQ